MAIEGLSEYIKRIMRERDYNYRAIERNAQEAGYKISHATVGNIVNSRYADVGTETLRALAHGLKVPEGELMSTALHEKSGGKARRSAFEKSKFETMYSEYLQLSPKDKRELDVILNMVDAEIKRRRLHNPPAESKASARGK